MRSPPATWASSAAHAEDYGLTEEDGVIHRATEALAFQLGRVTEQLRQRPSEGLPMSAEHIRQEATTRLLYPHDLGADSRLSPTIEDAEEMRREASERESEKAAAAERLLKALEEEAEAEALRALLEEEEEPPPTPEKVAEARQRVAEMLGDDAPPLVGPETGGEAGGVHTGTNEPPGRLQRLRSWLTGQS